MSKKKLRLLKYLFMTLSYVGLFLPLVIMFCINWNKYIVQREGLAVTFGGVTFCFMVVLATRVGIKKFNSVFWSTLMLIVVYSLNSIIQDLLPLTFCFWIGTIVYKILEMPTNYYKKRLRIVLEEIDRTYTRETVKKEIAKEQEKTIGNGRY